jgi:hypothetical protein
MEDPNFIKHIGLKETITEGEKDVIKRIIS